MSIAQYITSCVTMCHNESVANGWWDNLITGEKIDAMEVAPIKLLLVHSEISEAVEGLRKNTMDDHLKHRKSIEVELADALIRIFDLGGALELDLGGAVKEKMAYNAKRLDHKPEERAKKHGKKF